MDVVNTIEDIGREGWREGGGGREGGRDGYLVRSLLLIASVMGEQQEWQHVSFIHPRFRPQKQNIPSSSFPPPHPPNSTGALSLFIRARRASICSPGNPNSNKRVLRTSALERPTSARRATAWRLREERVTWRKEGGKEGGREGEGGKDGPMNMRQPFPMFLFNPSLPGQSPRRESASRRSSQASGPRETLPLPAPPPQ